MKAFFRKVAYILGFICIWPIFIDANSFELILLDFNETKVTAQIENGAPIPIGLFSFLLFISVFGVKSVRGFKNLLIIFLIYILFYLVFNRLGPLKTLALYIPFATLLLLTGIVKENKELHNFVKGYILGAVIFLMLYIISLFQYVFYTESADFNSGGRQFFGFEIYQYLVSVSAVFSLLFCVIFFILYNSHFRMYYSKIMNIFILLGSSILLFGAIRKAALIDAISLIVIVVYFQFSGNKTSRDIKSNILTISLIIFFGFFYSYLSSSRDASVSYATEQRLEPYLMILINLTSTDINGILFGYGEEGFGGYSNLILDIFVRSGIFGIVVYLLSFNLIIYKLFLSFRNKYINLPLHIKRGVMALFGILISNVVVGNIVNLNLIVPYYYVNLLCVLCVCISIILSFEKSNIK